jgi:hypothetical protein
MKDAGPSSAYVSSCMMPYCLSIGFILGEWQQWGSRGLQRFARGYVDAGVRQIITDQLGTGREGAKLLVNFGIRMTEFPKM